MLIREILILVAFAALVCATEVEDNEQKKRGAAKTTTLNAIPTGAQKPDYTYSIYPQTNTQSNPNPSYQTQVPNSFYPTQGSNQYYTQNSAPDNYPTQPQINLIPPPSSTQFVPLNFVTNPGYQTKYQIIPTKTQNGNIQVAFIPQGYQTQPVVQYPQYYSANPQQNQQSTLTLSPQGQYNLAPNYQQLAINPYLGQMLLLAQPNPSLYNNFLYQNPLQSLYNYYPGNAQPKYAYSVSPQGEYEKGPVTQNAPKEDNEIVSSSHNTEYITSSDNSNYKNAYTSRGSSYSKL